MSQISDGDDLGGMEEGPKSFLESYPECPELILILGSILVSRIFQQELNIGSLGPIDQANQDRSEGR